MTLDEAKRRIEELERRIRELEARPPIQYHYHMHQDRPPLSVPNGAPGAPPYIICGPAVGMKTPTFPDFSPVPIFTGSASH